MPEPRAGRRRLFGGRKAEIQPVKDTTEAPAPPSPRDEAIAVLKQGVTAWNAWVVEKRKADPDFRPDLSEVDFRKPEWRETPLWRERQSSGGLDKARICLFSVQAGGANFEIEPIELKGANLRRTNLEGPNLEQAHLEGASLWDAHLEGAKLRKAHLEGASLWHAHLEGAKLGEAHLEGASLREAHLEGAKLEEAHLEGTDLREAHLEGANLWGAFLMGSDLCQADFTRVNVSGIVYKPTGFWLFRRNSMLGRYLGIRGVDSCYGSPGFRRDALDQDFIDDKYESVRLRDDDRKWQLNRIPGRIVFVLWGFFDYGRSILSLLIFAAAIIGAIGWWYQGLEASHAIAFRDNLADIGADSPTLQHLRPWFAALMGFATLGLNDMVKPNTLAGAAAMVLDVVAGFSTLGLFIAVFQNKFARRS